MDIDTAECSFVEPPPIGHPFGKVGANGGSQPGLRSFPPPALGSR
jgi:hypothetical protein